MTRYHYIKKFIYLRYRLSQLDCTDHVKDIRYSVCNNFVPYPPFKNGAQTYQEAWDKICEVMRTIEGLENLK